MIIFCEENNFKNYVNDLYILKNKWYFSKTKPFLSFPVLLEYIPTFSFSKRLQVSIIFANSVNKAFTRTAVSKAQRLQGF